MAAALLVSASGGLAAQEAGSRPRGLGTGAMVQGTVVDRETGVPVRSATVTLWQGHAGVPRRSRLSGLGAHATDDRGRFLFRDVAPGSYRLSVTALGYRAMEDTLYVFPDTDLDILLQLSADPIRLEPLVVVARPGGARLPALRDVQPTGSPTFAVTREDIEERRPRYLTDLLHLVPGGRVVAAPGIGNTLLLRGGCRPGIWIDGVGISGPEGMDQLVSPGDVEAIHVYHGYEVPVELGSDPCGGVVIWTRDGRPTTSEAWSPPRPGLARRLSMAVAFVLLAVVLSR